MTQFELEHNRSSFMGVIGIHQQRQALELEKIGTDFFSNGQHFQSAYSEFCFDIPQDNVVTRIMPILISYK